MTHSFPTRRSSDLRLSVMSLEGGEVESSARLNVMTQMAVAEAIDTFVVVGDFDLPDRRLSPATIELIRAVSAGARRPPSVCMGAFLFAAAGLLGGRREIGRASGGDRVGQVV